MQETAGLLKWTLTNQSSTFISMKWCSVYGGIEMVIVKLVRFHKGIIWYRLDKELALVSVEFDKIFLFEGVF